MHSHRSLATWSAAFFSCLVFTLSTGCNEPPDQIDADTFDQSCQAASDCVRVIETTCLECRVGATAAINKEALDDFQQAQDDVDCDGLSTENCNNATVLPYLTCLENTCGIWAPSDPAGLAAEFDRSCTDDTDCVPIATSAPDYCTTDTCDCPDLAVNRDAWQQAIVASCDEGSPDDTCEEQCSNGRTAACENGTCILQQQ